MTTCFWHRSPSPGNLGDALTPIILEALSLPVEWASKAVADMVACGSVIDATRPGMYVWGAGAMSKDSRPDPEAYYYAVRGPLTERIVELAGGICSGAIGDPALLLPGFHDDPIEQRWHRGFVRHYADDGPPDDDAVVEISPVGEPLAIVDQIRECWSVVSSSLHGLVVAEAYEIPWEWRPCDRLKGDGTKFLDFAASVGRDAGTLHRIGLGGGFDPGPLLQSFAAVKAHVGADS